MEFDDQKLNGTRWCGIHGDFPEWTTEPDIESIKRAIQENGISTCSTITPLAQEVFNRTYNVQGGPEELVLRVALPVDPKWKTMSEVATMEWIWDNTSLPVPKVVAYEANLTNPAGFEWILTRNVPGEPLENMWWSMEWTAKEKLVAQIAQYLASTFRKQFSGIGNIYPDSPAHTQDRPKVGRIVDADFFGGQRGLQDVARGPFRSSSDWYAAILQVRETEYSSYIASHAGQDIDSDDDEAEYLETAERALPLVKKLQAHISDVFGEEQTDGKAEASILWHDDLDVHNIMVDSEGTLTGVVGWECVSAVPLWLACEYPGFLWVGEERQEKPDPSDGGRLYMDDGSKNDMMWERLEEYEKTHLRSYFLEQMKVLEPRWVEIFEAQRTNPRKADFEWAMRNCHNAGSHRSIKRRTIDAWLDSLSTDSPRTVEEVYKELEQLDMERMIEDSNRRAREYREARQAEAQTSIPT